MTTGTEEFLKLFLDGDDISVEEALSIPAFASCINLIANLIASLPINLYKEEGDGKTQVVRNDPRVALVNEDTGDLLDAVQFKTALVRDYLLYGAGYAYVNWRGNTCKSIHYVEHSMVNPHTNIQTDPIFKTATLYVGTKQYDPYKFIVIARNTKDGITGKSIVRECSTALRTYHNLLRYEKLLASTGGAKRGVIEAEKQLSDLAMDKLKAAWLKLFKNGEERGLFSLESTLVTVNRVGVFTTVTALAFASSSLAAAVTAIGSTERAYPPTPQILLRSKWLRDTGR